MADPIVRWRNTSVRQLCEFTQILPHKPLPKTEAREIIEKNWTQWDGGNNFFRTPYQLAAQLGLYYEDDSTLYPRFDHVTSLQEAEIYLREWVKRYYIPNPYTGSINFSGAPVVMVPALEQALQDNPDGVDFIQFFDGLLNVKLANLDIVANLFSRFTALRLENGMVFSDVSFENIGDTRSVNNKDDKKAFFDTFNDIPLSQIHYETYANDAESLQRIYYGAPGTGKSYEVKRLTKDWEKKGRVVRTTFHPDSDYSTFVGAYKPTMEETDGGKRITYEFVGQAFLQAYVEAWKNRADHEYLVIEEINRGNCAQIFGDLFQLLDRGDDGFSEYPIRADKDLQRYLHDALRDIDDEGGKYVKVKNGEELRLPDNLYIYATMNTSDQSLFPIDSAFKRRWDWKYVMITKGVDDSGGELNWFVDLGSEKYPWWDFLEAINKRILRATNSADKQLGFFFCTAKNNLIKADMFVNKVVFYLWNDVFKDYPDNGVFRDPDNNTPISFDDFCEAVGRDVRPVVSTIQKFFKNLGIKKVEPQVTDSGKNLRTEEIVEGENDDVQDGRNLMKLIVKFPDGTDIYEGTKFETYKAALCKIGLDRVSDILSQTDKYRRFGCTMVSKVQEKAMLNRDYFKYVPEGEYFIVRGMNGDSMVSILTYLSNELELGLEIIHE